MKISLPDQWTNLCSKIGIDGASQWRDLHQAYTTSGLAYHNLSHIEDCLTQFLKRKHEAENPIAVELAIWFHDAIYDPRASDNEERSAALASDFIDGTPFTETVTHLILATKHDVEPSSHDTRLLCDIDLSILGSPPLRYLTYAEAIRQEYAWVPNEDYRTGRCKILKQFLKREFIYFLESSRKGNEELARNNLKEEISKLEG